MCGIVGLWDPQWRQQPAELCTWVQRMVEAVRHRGPDDSGVWVSPTAGLGLGHTRLSVIDLSPAGHQPMVSACGRYVVVYNGEIYNYPDLRRDLEERGHRFLGHSDTEVLLAAIAEWGLEKALERLIGMFALAVWDVPRQRLALVRDRLGKKPLYYGWWERKFVFASELKALAQLPGFSPEIHRGALALFLQHNYVPGPWSIYRDIYKLPPGTVLELSEPAERPNPQAYWSLQQAAARGMEDPFRGTREEAADELYRLVADAVRRRMIADVPLGAFLSGGIDSSLVVALMQAHSHRPVRTFTIGFEEREYDEAPYAAAVARHLGTDHTEQYVRAREAWAVIPRLPEIYDEPFGDSSAVPTFLVSELARRHVTVVLSGDGGDELFGGYQRYLHIGRLWRALGRVPLAVRKAAAGAIAWGAHGLPGALRTKVAGRAERLRIATPGEMYVRHNMHWPDAQRLVLGAEPLEALADQPDRWPNSRHYLEQWMYADTVSYLPDDILVKVDRASMAVALEARAPLLDHRVVEFAWRLPLEWKIRRGTGKWLLRRVLQRHVPRELFERPKAGFGVPIDHWLRGPLRDWAEALLDEHRLRQQGFFDPAPIRQKWNEHLSGRTAWHYPLWDVLMFQAWYERWSRPAAGTGPA